MEEAAPVYVVLAGAGDHADSPKVIYNSVKDVAKFVNSPEGKKINARFRKFGTPREAQNFLDSGPCFSACEEKEKENVAVPSEPVSPFSGVNRIQMNELKKYIDKGDMENFMRLVETNPRFLVNTGGDVASIVMEGFRYNALHLAAKAGQAEIVAKVLNLCNCLKFLTRLYGTSEEDVLQRRDFIISSYLNTPDKGNFDTPLHFATKFGKLNVVKELAKYQLLDKTAKNKSGKTALEVACERYNENDKQEVLREIQLTLQGIYVNLTRTHENTRPSLRISTTSQIDSDILKICASAGPFLSYDLAEEFAKKWQISGKEIKLLDFEKGWEKVGRVLAGNECENRVGWAETWRFLGENDGLVNLETENGLRIVEEFLSKRKTLLRQVNKFQK
ncbi:unnamed protein product [Caenorhabditis angaria]|uniref:ANKLE2 third alpha/beta domain-containing protein n=1 Tax=Caenorhabditis angaria TaxID=860376 RepID=A0A9P1IC93_9PELO|nr:unnamed protein product [Caenorhabditis angaria]